MVKRRWWFRMVIVAVCILVGWVASVSFKQVERTRRIQEEISALENEATKVRRENETLSEKISYFASDDFREQEAKKKLGLKKSDETVVEVKPSRPDQDKSVIDNEMDGKNLQETQAVSHKSSTSVDVKNYEKWWRAFFGLTE